MSMLRRAMLYLGLGPDEEYDDIAHAAEGPPTPQQPPPEPDEATSPVSQSRTPATPMPGEAIAPAVRPISPEAAVKATGVQRTGSVRTVPAPNRANPAIVAPQSFNDAQTVADRFKSDQPVIVNLQGVDSDLSRRIIDFASGLCYGLGGHMEKVAHLVYLLTPSNVEVSAEDRRKLAERGLYD